jgi:hypothetical protein
MNTTNSLAAKKTGVNTQFLPNSFFSTPTKSI